MKTQINARGMMLSRLSETQWQAQVLAWAHRGGWLAHHTHDSRFQEWGTDKGFPDLVLVRAPRVLFIELKKERGKPPTVAQLHWLAQLRLSPGVEAYVWKPSDEETVRQILLSEANDAG